MEAPKTLSITQTGTIIGTPQYMAPEQLEGGEADGAFGYLRFRMSIYEMLTGNRAFDGKSHAGIAAQILFRRAAAIAATATPHATGPGIAASELSCKRP